MQDAPAFTAVLFGLRGCLVQAANGSPLPTPGALDALTGLRRQQVPCIWLDELSASQGESLASVLPDWLPDLSVFDLRVGGHAFDIRFWHDGAETKFEVLRGDPKAVERSSAGDQARRLKSASTPA